MACRLCAVHVINTTNSFVERVPSLQFGLSVIIYIHRYQSAPADWSHPLALHSHSHSHRHSHCLAPATLDSVPRLTVESKVNIYNDWFSYTTGLTWERWGRQNRQNVIQWTENSQNTPIISSLWTWCIVKSLTFAGVYHRAGESVHLSGRWITAVDKNNVP